MESLSLQADRDTSQESSHELFERSKLKGKAYSNLICRLTGASDNEDTTDDNPIEEYQQAGEAYFHKQKELFYEQSFDAKKLLEQIFKTGLPEDFSDPEACTLQELSPGVFIVKIKDTLYRKIRPGARAVAVKVSGGVSFVMTPSYEDKEFEEKELKENIPHEVHHLVWKGVKEAGLAKTSEANADFQEAFLMFQDELLARLASEGSLFGYTHLAMLDPVEREAFKTANPETFTDIIETASDLNDFLKEIAIDLRRRDIQSSNLIGAVIESTSFETLQKNLHKVREHILTMPITKPDEADDSGWGSA